MNLGTVAKRFIGLLRVSDSDIDNAGKALAKTIPDYVEDKTKWDEKYGPFLNSFERIWKQIEAEKESKKEPSMEHASLKNIPYYLKNGDYASLAFAESLAYLMGTMNFRQELILERAKFFTECFLALKYNWRKNRHFFKIVQNKFLKWIYFIQTNKKINPEDEGSVMMLRKAIMD